MILDKPRIPKLGDSSRKFIQENQRKAMNDPPFVEKIKRTRTDKGRKVSGRFVETRSQKSSEKKTMLEVEVHPEPAMDENREGHGRKVEETEDWRMNLLW